MSGTHHRPQMVDFNRVADHTWSLCVFYWSVDKFRQKQMIQLCHQQQNIHSMSTFIQVVLLLCVHWFCIKPSSLTNCPDSSDHLEQVYCLSPQLEINTVKQNLVSVHHISVTNSHNCRSAEPSMFLKQDWRILCLLLPFRKFSLLHCNSFYFLFAWFLMIYFNIVCLNVILLCVSFALVCLMWSTLSCLIVEMCRVNAFSLLSQMISA